MMEPSGGLGSDNADGPPSVRRQSRRMSIQKMVGAAINVVTKLTEPRKEIDPEYEPDFTQRHPQWEDELPPIHPHDVHAPELLAIEQAPLSEVKPQPAKFAMALHKSESASRACERWKLAYISVKKTLAVRDQSLRSSIGIGGELEGLALGIWDRYNPWRIFLFQLVYNKKTEYAIFVLINFHVLIMILKASLRGSWKNPHITMDQLNIIDAVLTSIFSVECFARIACLGLYKGPNTYLRNTYNRLDFLSVLDSWAQLIAVRFSKNMYFLRFLVFRMFRAMLTLRDIEFFGQVLAIFEALRRSMEPLEDVMLLALVLLFFYSLIGLQFFGSDLQYRCVRKSDGQFAYPVIYCSHFTDRGFVCPSNQACKKVGGNPGYGIQTFDMIPFSLLTLFQVVSLEGWSFVMYVMGDVEFKYAVAYFITLVIVVAYFLVNIVVAAISGVFLRVRHEHQALLKKNKNTKTFSFYNATMLASILKDVIEDDKKMTLLERFRKGSEQMKARLNRAASRTGSGMKRLMSSSQSFGNSFRRTNTLADIDYDWDPEGRTALSREFSRSFSRRVNRTMSRGARAAQQTVSSKCRYIVESKVFRYSELFAISANLLILCLHFEGISNKFLYTLYAFEALFIVAFTTEMVLRFLAVGLVQYMDDKMNVWDTVVIITAAGAIMTRAYPNISGARMLRWFYIDKKQAKTHTSIVTDCLEGLAALAAVSFFFLLIIFVFSVIGMQLYAGEYYDFPEGYPRNNFDNIFSAMYLWFICTTTDSWASQMWNAVHPGVTYRWIAPFLFVTYIIITVFLVLNLVIAVILEKTELTDDQKKKIQKTEYLKHLKSRQKRLFSSKGSGTWVVGAVEGAAAGVKSISKRLYTKKVRNISITRSDASCVNSEADPGLSNFLASNQVGKSSSEEKTTTIKTSETITSESGGSSLFVPRRPSTQGLGRRSFSASPMPLGPAPSMPMRKRASQILLSSGFSTDMPDQKAPNTPLRNSILALVNQSSNVGVLPANVPDQISSLQTHTNSPSLLSNNRESFELQEYEELHKSFKMRDIVPWYLSNDSLFLFAPEHNLRKWCQKLVSSRVFTIFIIIVIAVSISVVISMKRDTKLDPVFAKLNIFVFTMFSLEFLMKIIAYGFLLTPDPYLGDIYNFLDLFLLILDALFLYPNWQPTQLKVIRILSALRPLRLLCRIQGMKVLTTNLLRTIPAVTSVLIFTFVVFSVFSVVGVQMFRGRYASCNSLVDHKIECVGNDLTDAQILGPRVWSNPPFHFDNFPAALLSLFVLSTFDNVQDGFINPAMDIAGPKGSQPKRDASPLNAIFFIVFICIGGFFILRMFVGVFIDQFGLISGSKLLTERQKLFRDTNRIIQRMTPLHKPKIPRFWLRRFCHRLVTSPKYPDVIRAVIILNYTWLSSHFAGQPKYLTVHRNRVEASFASFYVLDVAVKLIGHEIMTGDNWSCILTDSQAEFPFCTLNHPVKGSDCGNSAFSIVFYVLFITLATHIFMNMFVASIIDTITFGLLKEKTIITPANLIEYQTLWNDPEFDPTSSGYIGLHKLRTFLDRLGIPLGHRHNAAPQWFARVQWEVFGFHVEGKGIPFRELLETLTLYKIGSKGLELAVRIEREKQIQKIYRYGATIKIQAAIRGFLAQRCQEKKKSEQKRLPTTSTLSSMLFE
ncbi:hypothetical protein KP509_11G019800 [Ceratopteris richardii]|uniref:Ion transport domain-containing protein n=2 Tax=Ceratopteris richardii TaxID=49495 RepID=A0A8T2TSH2_CERRI|nr:hypothetical protein KP509_11G019800 [Ceratopteris richardii]